MKNRTAVISVIIVIAVIIAGYFLLRGKKTEVTETPKNTQTETKAEGAVVDSYVTEKTYSEPDQYATFDVTYPQFSNATVIFNQKIEKFVMDAIAEHKKNSADNWKARFETQFKGEGIKEFPKEEEKFSLKITWTPVQVNSKDISFIITTSGYSGGAHGYENISSFNYDVKAKKEITLKSLFPNDPNYLKTISDFARKDLNTQFHSRMEIKTKDDEAIFKESILPMLNEGTVPEISNFSVFTFTSKAVTFYFPEYQVAPYAMGSSTVVMPR
jgi:hypothetical protein